MTQDSLISKVRALLAKADLSKNPNVHEATLCAEKAQELIMKHNLTIVDGDEPTKFGSYECESKVDPWRRRLANSIAINLGGHCCWFDRSARGSSQGKFVFSGVNGSAESMAALYENICDQLEGLYIIDSVRTRENNVGFGQRLHGKSIRAAWFAGAVKTISERLRARKTEIENESSHTDLVLSKNALTKYVEDQFPTLRKHKEQTVIRDRGAFTSGRKSGGKVDFGDSRVRTSQRQLTR